MKIKYMILLLVSVFVGKHLLAAEKQELLKPEAKIKIFKTTTETIKQQLNKWSLDYKKEINELYLENRIKNLISESDQLINQLQTQVSDNKTLQEIEAKIMSLSSVTQILGKFIIEQKSGVKTVGPLLCESCHCEEQ